MNRELDGPSPITETVVPKFSLKSLFGNASSDEALVVGFAETHKQGPHYIAISQLISELAQPGDVLLVEGVQRGKEADTDIRVKYDIPLFVRIEGWDDMEAAQAAAELAREMFFATKAADQAHRSGSEETQTLGEKAGDAIAAFKDAAIKKRNPSLLTAITDSRTQSPQSRTFVIAGALHFVEDPELIEALGEKTTFCILKTQVSEDMQQRLAAISAQHASGLKSKSTSLNNESPLTRKQF